MNTRSEKRELESTTKPKLPTFRLSQALLPALFLVACSGAGDNDDVAQRGFESPAASGLLPTAQAQAQPGKILFLQCAACHAVKAGAPSKTGPNLHCVIGRQAGSLAEHEYSNAFQEAAARGLTWDRANLSSFIENSKAIVPNNSMAFGGVADAEKQLDIIDYLASECGTDDA